MRRTVLGATAALTLALMACGGAPAASPAQTSPTPSAVTAAPTPASSAPAFARGALSIQTKSGPVPLNVEIADDEAKREYGLMNRSSLAPDAGMLFVFNPPANAKQTGFWMADTLIPLSVAFVEPNMAVESIQEMQALNRDVHYAPRDYAYAIEANEGFFSSHNVNIGDLVSVRR